MKKSEITKQRLRNHTCDNCDLRTMSNEEMSNYMAQWREEPPFDWCRYRKSHPRENTCSHWVGDIVDDETFSSSDDDIEELNNWWVENELYSNS